MQVKDLYSEVARLGFDTLLEDTTAFYYAVNRALIQISVDIPEKKVLKLRHAPQKNLLGGEELCSVRTKETGKELVIGYGTNAKAYYFECDGNGQAYIETADGLLRGGPIQLSSGGTYKTYSGIIRQGENFVDTPLRIRFEGNYAYHVTNVALFGEIMSDNDKDVPKFGRFVEYDMRMLTDDFLSFDSPLIECADGTPLKEGYQTVGDYIIILSYSDEGIYYVKYNRKPREIEYFYAPSDDTQKIELSTVGASVIALLVASYIWLDDEEAKAQYYRSLYQEAVVRHHSRMRNYTPIKYVTNGW